jgi:hypothetical protein
MSEINHIKVFIMCTDDITADVDHLHVKKNSLSEFFLYSYRGFTRLIHS